MSALNRCRIRQLLLLLLLPMVLVTQSSAGVIEDLYAIAIPVYDGEPMTRKLAFDEGLAQILIRVTGNSDLFAAIKLPRSSAYVLQFQYLELEPEQKARLNVEASAGTLEEQRVYSRMLWIQYNETKVNEYVRNNALPLWDKHRADTVIWLAVNDGVNRYVLKSRDKSALKIVTDESAGTRAVPVIWPQISVQEQSLRFADVWAGFKRPLQELSEQFASGPILIGRLLWSGERWSSEWSLLLEGNDIDWNLDHADYKVLLRKAIDIAADNMGQQFAYFDTGDMNSFHSLDIEVKNVNSINALNRVKQFLLTVPSVQKIRLVEIENEQVFFNVSLRSSTEDFISFIETASMLLLLPDIEPKPSGLKPLLQHEVTAAQIRSAAYRFQLQQ